MHEKVIATISELTNTSDTILMGRKMSQPNPSGIVIYTYIPE